MRLHILHLSPRLAHVHHIAFFCASPPLIRCRKLYEKYLEWNPANCHAWIKFSELERALGEVERTRGIYELAIAQPLLDMPEALWKVCGRGEGGEGQRVEGGEGERRGEGEVERGSGEGGGEGGLHSGGRVEVGGRKQMDQPTEG